jgi:hypothetical protein
MYTGDKFLADLLSGKSEYARRLFDHFCLEYQRIGPVTIHAHKTMITFANSHKGVAYVTQSGKKFIHIVFPFYQRYDDNFCFQKIQQVPGRNIIYHHFRMLRPGDINEEVRSFMKLALYE